MASLTSMQMAGSKSHFCPMPYRYGIVHINAVAMLELEHLNDPIAPEEARSMHTGDYLVYLRELPFPGQPWWRFTMGPIEADLRLVEPEQAITRSMCVPIYPNTAHSRNREPVRTIPEFPIAKLATDIDIRIRTKPDDEPFDDSRAIRLPAEERLSLSYQGERISTDDTSCSCDVRRRHKLSSNLLSHRQASQRPSLDHQLAMKAEPRKQYTGVSSPRPSWTIGDSTCGAFADGLPSQPALVPTRAAPRQGIHWSLHRLDGIDDFKPVLDVKLAPSFLSHALSLWCHAHERVGDGRAPLRSNRSSTSSIIENQEF
ncbi:hypothetical protein NUW54_g3145 [Trametes sanguinea]|uniref:Uncharacterized protein n=1 Tax=Trametes sanguinea TaxID=158606 RepID=A0ACC1Q1K6_9APHY|nr:hypothetical protein NUW54_g3145 [Trametes sanguinea]